MMKASKDAVTLIKHFEGCSLKAYPDPGSADGKPWTIGYGHTGKDVVKGLRWTQAQADAALAQDVARFAGEVEGLIKVSVTQSQFDALVSFAYNIGVGALAGSTLLRLLSSGSFSGAARQFERWDKQDGRPMLGLSRRRRAERLLFETGDIISALAAAEKVAR